MALVKVTARVPAKDDKPELTCEVVANLGEDLTEKIELFGEKVVNDMAEGQLTVRLQAGLRRCLEAGMSQEDIQKYASEWKPGVTRRIGGAVTVDQALEVFRKMSPEERETYMAQI